MCHLCLFDNALVNTARMELAAAVEAVGARSSPTSQCLLVYIAKDGAYIVQTVHITVRTEGPIHIMRISDRDDSAAATSGTQADTQAQLQHIQDELTKVNTRLKQYQDEKGLLIDLLLDDAKQKQSQAQAAPRLPFMPRHGVTRETLPPAQHDQVLASQNLDDLDLMPGPHVGSVTVRDSMVAKPGRQTRSMMQKLRGSQNSTATAALSTMQAQASASSFSLPMKKLQRRLRPQRSFPATLPAPRHSGDAGGASLSPACSSLAASVAANMRRSSTGAISIAQHSDSETEGELDAELLRTPPQVRARVASQDTAAAPHAQTSSASSPSIAAPHSEPHLAPRQVQPDGAEAANADNAAPAPWSVFNQTFERDSPERGSQTTSPASATLSPAQSPWVLRSIWPFRPQDANRGGGQPTAEAVSDSGPQHGSGSAAVIDSLDLDSPTSPDAASQTLPVHSGILHVMPSQTHARSVSWQSKAACHKSAPQQEGACEGSISDDSITDAGCQQERSQLQASAYQEAQSEAQTSQAGAESAVREAHKVRSWGM